MRLSRAAVAVALGGAVLLLASSARSQDERSQDERSQDGEARVRDGDVAGWRIFVQKPGVVRIPIADLPGRALCPAEGSPVTLSLTTRGVPVPYWVNPKRNLLAFWAEPDPESHDARGRCYRLREAKTKADPVSWLDEEKLVAATVAEADTVAEGTRTLLPDEPRAYHPIECLDAASLARGARRGGNWFHDRPLTFTSDRAGRALLTLTGVYVVRIQKMPLPGGRVFQEIGIRSSDERGAVTVKVNGVPLETTLGGAQGSEGGVAVELVAGKNTVELLGERAGLVRVQGATITFDAPVTPNVAFVAKGPTRFAGAEGLLAIDLDDGKLLEVKKGEKASFIASKKGHRTLVGDPFKVVSSARIEPYAKHESKLEHVDWLAVGPRRLLAAVRPLEAHRKAQGLTTAVLAFEDLSVDLADGSLDADAIRLAAEAIKPRFLLLVGDAARDGRPDDGPWLPTYLVDTYQNGASATDRLFVRSKDGEPAVAIGRFPCRTKDEVASLVAKTIAYESAPAASAQRELAFVCGEGRFGPMVDGMIENLFTQAVGKRVPSCFDVDVTYANPTSVYFFPPDDFAKRVIERLSQGPLIFDYVGHGATESLDTVHWGKKRFPIFTAADAAKVACPEGRNPIALITACWTGCFDQPERTVGEALLLNPKGAVAVLAASRISHPFANALLSLDLTQSLFEESGERLGTRVRKTLDGLSLESGGAEGKMVVSFGSSMLEEEGLADRLIEDERHLYNLLGDPALVVKLPRRISVDAPAEAPAGTTVAVAAGEAELASVTLERVRAPRNDLSGLDATAGPDSMKDAATEARVRDTYQRANDLVLVRGTVSGARAVLALPRDLAPGKYVVKLATRAGAVGSMTLVVQKAAPLGRKYY